MPTGRRACRPTIPVSTSCSRCWRTARWRRSIGSPKRRGWRRTCAGRINMASMAAAEMNHYEVLRDALERRGVDVVPAMTKYASALENYHRLTTPSTWLEALVKTYVGDALAADFYLEIADVAARRGGRRGARGAVGDRALAVRRRRGAGRGDGQREAAPPAGAVVAPAARARPSRRRSTCWPTTTNWSTWS